MKISFTGHRPSKLGGFSLPNPTYNYVCKETEKLLLKYKPDKTLSGMAIGYDQYAAAVCIRLKIPFVSVRPFVGQELKWPEQSQIAYNKLLALAAEDVIVSSGSYTASKMHIRNAYLVDNCDLLIACFDGSNSGGTYSCIEYAKKIGREVVVIDPRLANTIQEK